MVRLVLGLLVVGILAVVLFHTIRTQPASVPKDVAGEVKAVPAAKAQQAVQDQVRQIEQQNRAKLDRTMQESAR